MNMKDRKVITGILLFILVALMLLQYRVFQISGKHVAVSEVAKIQTKLLTEKAEIEQLRDKISHIEGKLAQVTNSKRDKSIKGILSKEKSDLETLLGYNKISGEGVIIIVTDGQRELLNNENPNNLMVHDVDIRNLVDDLRNAGAEAISINGQRIVFNQTKIYCAGPTVKINDDVFSQPYIIKAIGDRYFLEAAVNAPNKYGDILRRWGIFVEVNTSVNVEISAYIANRKCQYMSIVEEKEL